MIDRRGFFADLFSKIVWCCGGAIAGILGHEKSRADAETPPIVASLVATALMTPDRAIEVLKRARYRNLDWEVAFTSPRHTKEWGYWAIGRSGDPAYFHTLTEFETLAVAEKIERDRLKWLVSWTDPATEKQYQRIGDGPITEIGSPDPCGESSL